MQGEVVNQQFAGLDYLDMVESLVDWLGELKK